MQNTNPSQDTCHTQEQRPYNNLDFFLRDPLNLQRCRNIHFELPLQKNHTSIQFIDVQFALFPRCQYVGWVPMHSSHTLDRTTLANMSIKSFIKIIKCMTPRSAIQALGRVQYDHIVNKYKLVENIFLFPCTFQKPRCMVMISIKPSTEIVTITAPWSGVQVFKFGKYGYIVKMIIS